MGESYSLKVGDQAECKVGLEVPSIGRGKGGRYGILNRGGVSKMTKHAYANQICPFCKKERLVRFPEAGLPDFDDTYFTECLNCGSTIYFVAGPVFIPPYQDEERSAEVAQKYQP